MRSIIAFANTAGGTLLIGVEDKSRHVRGIREPLAMEERLANLVSDNIVPRLMPDLEILPWRRTHVLAIQVFPSPARPHYLRSTGSENGAYVRVGSTNRRVDSEMIAELKRYALGESFDEQPLPELAAAAFGVKVQFVDVLSPKDIDAAFRRMVKERTEAVLAQGSSVLNAHRIQVAELAAKHRLPAMYYAAEFVEAGGLMFYGVNFPDLFRRAATYVDKILKGRKPADLPVEQPIKFEFIVNLKAAKQIGLTIPPNVLVRADRVIK